MLSILIFKFKKIIRFICPNLIQYDYSFAHFGQINLDYWHPIHNLGDQLSLVIVEYMLLQKNLSLTSPTKKPFQHLMAVGSLLGSTKINATIWGTGILNEQRVMAIQKKRKFTHLDIRCVRGPLTQFVLENAGYSCPKVYGDPAILMPLIYKPKSQEKKYDITLIQHHSFQNNNHPGFHHLNIQTNDYQAFIDELCASKLVISSSLHGIILAESYGIPAIFYNQNNMWQQSIKFLDYYYSTKRYNIKAIHSLNEIDTIHPMELPDLTEMQKELIATFPYDLWR